MIDCLSRVISAPKKFLEADIAAGHADSLFRKPSGSVMAELLSNDLLG